MTRTESEKYVQDRLGNVRREIDGLRAQAGMEGAGGDMDGIAEIAGGDTGSDLVAYKIPEHAQQSILIELHAYNSTDTEATYTIKEATLNEDDSVNTVTKRSVPINVAGGATRIHSYEGIPFDSDAIVINAAFEGEIGVGVIDDHHEENEPASEQTEAP